MSGLLTKPALAVWSTEPGPGLLVGDLVERGRGGDGAPLEAVSQHRGDATIATYTVTYAGDEPASSFVIADLDAGDALGRDQHRRRSCWRSASGGELIGRRVRHRRRHLRAGLTAASADPPHMRGVSSSLSFMPRYIS